MNKQKIVLGLTGNICSGKTTVLKLFAGLGCPTISADDVAHEVLDNNKHIRNKVLKYFGTADRKKLAGFVFTDAKKRLLLETILHPEITRLIEERINSTEAGKVIVIEIPLLFETGWDEKVDYTVYVSCPAFIRKERFYEKWEETSFGDFESRDTAQISERYKADHASFTIDNSKDLEHARKEVKKVLLSLHIDSNHSGSSM